MSKIHILPNLRKGLSKEISHNLIKEGDIRPSFKVDLGLSVNKAGEKDADGNLSWSEYEKSEDFSRDFFLIGPVDIRAISNRAISQVVPADKSTGFSNGYMPYVEFYEEDFPWRYTPSESSANLKPWLMLLACKNNEFTIHTDNLGYRKVELFINDEKTYSEIFPAKDIFHLQAHVQVTSPDNVTDILNYVQNNPDDGVSRLFTSRKLEPFTYYTMFLVPAFGLSSRASYIPNLLSVVFCFRSQKIYGTGQRTVLYYSRRLCRPAICLEGGYQRYWAPENPLKQRCR